VNTLSANYRPRYHRWSGHVATGWWTFLPIATAGIRHVLKQNKTRLAVTSTLLFVIGSGGLFYMLDFVEQLVGTEEAEPWYEMLRMLLRVDLSSLAQFHEYREVLWRTIFVIMIRFELFWVLILGGAVGSGLIAQDLKARALPIYFSKPITPITYLLAKWMIVAAFLALAMLVPNLLSLLLGVLFAGGLSSWTQTLGLAWDILLSGSLTMVLGGTVVLALSSLTADRRYALVAWLAVCVLPMTAQGVLGQVLPPEVMGGWLGSISLSGDFMMVTERLFDLRQAWQATELPSDAFAAALGRGIPVRYPALVLLGVTVASIWLCYRRVVRFSRSAANL